MMKRREWLKLAGMVMVSSSLFAYDKTKIINTKMMSIKDPAHPTKGELKHTPDISLGAKDVKGYTTVTVTVGQDGIIHPSTEEHWIYKIELYADGRKVSEVDLEPVISRGFLSSKVKLDNVKVLKAISYCNLHGAWPNTLNIS